jgi:hypothetical protein
MKVFGRTTIREILQDRIVFRNLVPMDAELPKLDILRSQIGLAPGYVPRKSQLDYARVIVQLLKHVQDVDSSGIKIENLVLVGDTLLNDAKAFSNICQVSGWSGKAFIGSENIDEPVKIEKEMTDTGDELYLANRWASIFDFDRYCIGCNMPIGSGTVVVVDLDKTVLGARGRNSHVIDEVRIQAVHNTVKLMLGQSFDKNIFRETYDQFNGVKYHSFTSDNQDYLAYICLVICSGLFTKRQLTNNIESGVLQSFRQFIDMVEGYKSDLIPELINIHSDVYERVQVGDPTSFKSFRRNEYLSTVEHMGKSTDADCAEEILSNEIVITEEVRNMALLWKERGAILFGLSDKPDEASIPSPYLAMQGYLPIHHIEAWSVGCP